MWNISYAKCMMKFKAIMTIFFWFLIKIQFHMLHRAVFEIIKYTFRTYHSKCTCTRFDTHLIHLLVKQTPSDGHPYLAFSPWSYFLLLLLSLSSLSFIFHWSILYKKCFETNWLVTKILKLGNLVHHFTRNLNVFW